MWRNYLLNASLNIKKGGGKNKYLAREDLRRVLRISAKTNDQEYMRHEDK